MLLIGMRAALYLLPFPIVRWYLRHSARVRARRPAHPETAARAVAAVIAQAARMVPGGNNCLAQALAARILLARQGIASELVIGVRRDHRGTGPSLGAHAWLKVGEETLLGAASAGDYAPLPRLAGRL